MKKVLVIMLTGAMMLAAAACGGGNASQPAADAQEDTEDNAVDEADDTQEESAGEMESALMNVPEDPMTHDEYAAAEAGTEVVIAGYIQGVEALDTPEEDRTTANVFLQDEDGGYFLYQLPCTPKEYEMLTVGKKIKVKGSKYEWSGEEEVIDAVWQLEDDEKVYAPEDVTALLGTDELTKKQNMLVSFKGMTVESAGKDYTGKDVPFLYNWDGSGEEGDDLYFNVSMNGQTYNFTVDSDLCDKDSEAYRAVKELEIGDVIDMEGFLYWYEGPNPHITTVTKK